MQLMRLADVPLDQRDRVFHYSRFRAVTGTMILVTIALGALVFGWLKNAWLAYYVAAVVAICLPDLSEAHHRPLPLFQLAHTHDRSRALRKISLVSQSSLFRSRLHGCISSLF